MRARNIASPVGPTPSVLLFVQKHVGQADGARVTVDEVRTSCQGEQTPPLGSRALDCGSMSATQDAAGGNPAQNLIVDRGCHADNVGDHAGAV